MWAFGIFQRWLHPIGMAMVNTQWPPLTWYLWEIYLSICRDLPATLWLKLMVRKYCTQKNNLRWNSGETLSRQSATIYHWKYGILASERKMRYLEHCWLEEFFYIETGNALCKSVERNNSEYVYFCEITE